MSYIQEILDVDKLVTHIANGEISERWHPEFPELVIYNYTEKAAYNNTWTHETRTCRGLIVNLDTSEVLARPFAKFFNIGQAAAPAVQPEDTVWHYSNKEDGSLGIGYVTPDGQAAIATRGSFSSDQAIHATAGLSLDEAMWIAQAFYIGYTALYEIVYPDNRIVLDYGDFDGLIKIGGMEIATGEYMPQFNTEPTTVGELMARADRPNAEGWVIWHNPHQAVKIKQQDYVELHRIVTGLNRKSVWRLISTDMRDYKTMLESLPDELVAWAEGVAQELMQEYSLISRVIDRHYVGLLDYIYEKDITERREIAEWVQENVPREYVGFVFSVLDGKDIQDKVWKLVEPIGAGK